MDDFAAFVGFPSFRQLSAAGNPENPEGPGNGFRKRSEHWEMDDFAAFVVFPSFRQLSAAGKPENPEGPGNGFRKRSEHCEMDDFAAKVGFPSFRQLSAAGNLENPRSLEMGRRFCCFWGSPHFGSFRRPEIQKIQGALEMEPWKWLPEKERTLVNGRFCCFCVVPLISAAFGGRKSRKSKKKERTLRNGRFCCFCSVPLISAAFGGRKSRKSKGPWKWLPEKERTLGNGRFCCFCVVPLISAAFGGRKSRKSKEPGNGFRKRSEHWEMDDFAVFVGFPSFQQLSAAGNPENLRGLEMGRRFCCFCRVPLILAAFSGRKSRKSKGPWKWLANIGKWTILLLLWCSPHFGSFRRPEIQKIQGALEMASGKGANIAKWTILLLLWGSPHFGREYCETDDFAAFVGFPSLRQLSATGNPEGQKRPGRGQKQARRSQEEARKRPGRGRKRPEEAWKRPGRGQEEAGRGQEEARRGPEEAKAPKGQESRIWEKSLETQCFMNRK